MKIPHYCSTWSASDLKPRVIALKLSLFAMIFSFAIPNFATAGDCGKDPAFFSKCWFISTAEKGAQDIGKGIVSGLGKKLLGAALDSYLPGLSSMLGLGESDPFAKHAEAILNRIALLEANISAGIDAQTEEHFQVSYKVLMDRLEMWENDIFFNHPEHALNRRLDLYEDDLKKAVEEPLHELSKHYAHDGPGGLPKYGTKGLHQQVVVLGFLLPVSAERITYRSIKYGNPDEADDDALVRESIRSTHSIYLRDLFKTVENLHFEQEFSDAFQCEIDDRRKHVFESKLDSECQRLDEGDTDYMLDVFQCKYDGKEGKFDYRSMIRCNFVEDTEHGWRHKYIWQRIPDDEYERFTGVYGFFRDYTETFVNEAMDFDAAKEEVQKREWEKFVLASYGAIRPIIDEWWTNVEATEHKHHRIDGILNSIILRKKTEDFDRVINGIVYYILQTIDPDRGPLDVPIDALGSDVRAYVNYILMNGYHKLFDVLALATDPTLDPITWEENDGYFYSDMRTTFVENMSLDEAESLYRSKFAAKILPALYPIMM